MLLLRLVVSNTNNSDKEIATITSLPVMTFFYCIILYSFQYSLAELHNISMPRANDQLALFINSAYNA
jgi:hypothetical protein